jgi:hypothetical protein
MISEGTTPDPEGYKPMTLTGESLIEEIHWFRREFWLTTVTNEQRDEAIKALTFVYLTPISMPTGTGDIMEIRLHMLLLSVTHYCFTMW